LKWTESRFLKVIAVNVVESGQLRQRFVKWWRAYNDVTKREHCWKPLPRND
jgi:hypothetical protein